MEIIRRLYKIYLNEIYTYRYNWLYACIIMKYYILFNKLLIFFYIIIIS